MSASWGLEGNQTWADAYDSIVTAIKAETDATKRAELAAKAEKVLMATGGVAPIFYYTQPQMLKPNVKNVIRLNTGDVLWTYATVE